MNSLTLETPNNAMALSSSAHALRSGSAPSLFVRRYISSENKKIFLSRQIDISLVHSSCEGINPVGLWGKFTTRSLVLGWRHASRSSRLKCQPEEHIKVKCYYELLFDYIFDYILTTNIA